MSLDHHSESTGPLNRRDFLRAGAAAGLAIAAGTVNSGCSTGNRRLDAAPDQPLTAPKLDEVRIGFVGVGGMGMVHVNHLLAVPGAKITAVCDIVEDKVARAQDAVVKAGQPRPAGFSRGPRDFERLCGETNVDVVYTATPWEWHVPVCLAAMRNGKHAVTEVPAAYTIDGCWDLVEASEKYKRHCMMLENCCYDRAELMVLSMVRKGLFGEVLHAEAGYQHDLRDIKFSTGGEGLWRRAHSTRRNGNLYPTHGLGPVCWSMDVNRGDRLDYLVSMSGPSRGLQRWAAEHLTADDPRLKESYVLGDVNITLIRTVNGKTIYLVHDTNSPRPYARFNMVQGTKAIFIGYPNRIHVEGRSPGHGWEPLDNYASEFEHPFWRADAVKTAQGGHGAMDYLENFRLIKCLREGLPLDMDVYDAATWSVITELTERSVASRSKSIDVPDFTRGRWKSRPTVGVIDSL